MKIICEILIIDFEGGFVRIFFFFFKEFYIYFVEIDGEILKEYVNIVIEYFNYDV